MATQCRAIVAIIADVFFFVVGLLILKDGRDDCKRGQLQTVLGQLAHNSTPPNQWFRMQIGSRRQTTLFSLLSPLSRTDVLQLLQILSKRKIQLGDFSTFASGHSPFVRVSSLFTVAPFPQDARIALLQLQIRQLSNIVNIILNCFLIDCNYNLFKVHWGRASLNAIAIKGCRGGAKVFINFVSVRFFYKWPVENSSFYLFS